MWSLKASNYQWQLQTTTEQLSNQANIITFSLQKYFFKNPIVQLYILLHSLKFNEETFLTSDVMRAQLRSSKISAKKSQINANNIGNMKVPGPL